MLRDTLKIECKCTPQNPFYLRWLNRVAGYDYQMFQKRQLFENEQSDIITYQPFISDYSAAAGTHRLISKAIEKTVIIGIEQLSNADWNILSHVLNSPHVQYYNRWQQRWLDVIIDKTKCLRQTDESRHTIELTLLLPKPNIAI
jgi:hypothetical protein